MRKFSFSISFWFIYTLGFTVVLPTFLYYSTGGLEEPPLESATTAFIYLGLGTLLWLVLIVLYTRFLIQLIFTDKRRLERTATNGTIITAKITGNKQVGTQRDCAILDLTLAFNNLAGTPVEIPYQVNDGKPYENRFNVGNTIEMRANLDDQQATFVPQTIQVQRNKGILFLHAGILLLMLVTAVAYPVFSYQLESQGAGWRFLKFWHPWILVPIVNFGTGGFIWLLLRFIEKATGSPEQPLRMVLYGVKTTGTISNFSQTGMYINEQPQLSFDIEYTDREGMRQTVAHKKVVSLLEIHKLSNGPKEIMYLPNQPQNIIFYEDLAL